MYVYILLNGWRVYSIYTRRARSNESDSLATSAADKITHALRGYKVFECRALEGGGVVK